MNDMSVSLEQRYDMLEAERLTFLDRARRCAELTIPTLIPPAGHSKSTIYYTPWQGIGARGVNNLASKLLLALFPPNAPFFRLEIDDFTASALAASNGSGKEVIEAGLSKIERAVMAEIEGTGCRSPVFLAMKHLIVGGNVLISMPSEGGLRVFRMDSYVVKRDVHGNVIDCIAKDEVSPMALSVEERKLLDHAEQAKLEKLDKDEKKKDAGGSEPNGTDRTVKLFTRWYRTDPALGTPRWRSYQELNSVRVPGSQGVWPIDKPPFMALRWNTVECEDYGRSFIEEYLGDLISLEGLSKAIVEGSAAAARLVFLLNPNGLTKLDSFRKAENGDVIIGKEGDVTVVQSQKQADLTIASNAAKEIQNRLAQAFLMNSSVQRNAERVTAEEVRFMAQELEDALGGVYSILAQEFQFPFVVRIMDRMTKAKKLPKLPQGVVKPVIITGLEALGRGHDLQKYTTFLQVLAPLGNEVIAQFLKPSGFISHVASSLGIDPDDIVKTPDEIAQAQQQAQMAQQSQQLGEFAGKVAPSIIKSLGDQSMHSKDLAQAQAQQGQN
ncbi:portal protein [Bradyrhizobium sp. SZCCHNRI2049]|uniref:portal protein n=1 Tax=Bradyrhizobium sp. SZCCHNRI2049 TaxID=3057287 RepID=UPI00291643DD|nr:portal protein [Bradyrhizobium sp. SZCCHNRI2049]